MFDLHQNKRKVLIISQDSMELSTERVIDWINYLGHDFYRLNGDIFESLEKSILIESTDDLKLIIENKKLPKNYYSIWIRRWSGFDSIQSLIKGCRQFKLDTELALELTACFAQDISATKSLVLNMFNCEKFLSNINQLTVNKLNVLNQAKLNKFKVPDFIITNRKSRLVDFKKNRNVILKDLDSNFKYFNNNIVFASYGELMSLEKINSLPDIFFTSFFQEYIEKEFEIRAFFLNNKIYSMAIFSQSDHQTKVDFRRYNIQNANRTVPYKLPKNMERKIITLMNSLKLETGSIDILKSISGEYYFLEVNPVGQFGMVSNPCNYNLEYEIAKYLTY